MIKTGTKIKGDIRRDQIVRASFRIIGKKGVSSLTTAAIAREAGTSGANLYRHFKNKHEIYLAAVVHVQNRIMQNAEKAFSGDAPPLAKLKRFFKLQLELMENTGGIPRFMFSEELHVHRSLREKVVQTMYGVSEMLSHLIRSGQKAGNLRRDIDAKTTARMYIGMVQGLAFHWSLSGFSFSLAKEGAKTWKNFERCIIPEEPDKAKKKKAAPQARR